MIKNVALYTVQSANRGTELLCFFCDYHDKCVNKVLTGINGIFPVMTRHLAEFLKTLPSNQKNSNVIRQTLPSPPSPISLITITCPPNNIYSPPSKLLP